MLTIDAIIPSATIPAITKAIFFFVVKKSNVMYKTIPITINAVNTIISRIIKNVPSILNFFNLSVNKVIISNILFIFIKVDSKTV